VRWRLSFPAGQPLVYGTSPLKRLGKQVVFVFLVHLKAFISLRLVNNTVYNNSYCINNQITYD
jgi:hypothetical protein